MGKIFKNINEELERIKTLMFETDNLILNEKKQLNEQEASDKFKTSRSSFKLAKVSDVNTILRGGASKFDTYKVKGTGVINLFDKDGKMTPEGIELMKKSGLNLPAGQIVMRIGKVDDPNTDKIFFQVIPTKELSVVTQSGDIKNVDPSELEKLPTVQDVKPSTPASTSTTSSTPSSSEPSSTPSTTKTVDISKLESMKNKKASDFGVDKMRDITKDLAKGGYGWEIPGKKFYADYSFDPKYPITYTVENGIIVDIHYTEPNATNESFNMDLIFVNPLLFESIVNEQAAPTTKKYKCIGRCADNVEAFSDALSKLSPTDAAVDSAKTDAAKTTTTDTEKTTTTDTATKDTTETTEEKVYYRDGDPYEYKVINNVWHARKKGTSGKWLDITKYKSSVDILNKEFPEAKGAQSTGDGTDSGKKTGETESGEETTKTTTKSNKTWERSFKHGGTVRLTYTDNLIDPTLENIENMQELVESLVDCFDPGDVRERIYDARDFGDFLKNMNGVKINLPSFDSLLQNVKKNRTTGAGNQASGDGLLRWFKNSSEEYVGQRPSFIFFMDSLYNKRETETFSQGIDGMCSVFKYAKSDDAELETFIKYVKIFYPNNKCTANTKPTTS
jgi:hypothetical protein